MAILGGRREEFVAIPDGEVLEAVCLEVKDIKKDMWRKGEKEEDVPRVQFKFKVTESGEFEGKIIKDDTPTTWSNDERCKSHAWAERIYGEPIDADEPFDTDLLKDKPCRLVMGAKTVERRDGKGDWTYQWIDQILPPRRSSAAAQEQQPSGGGSGWGDDEEPF